MVTKVTASAASATQQANTQTSQANTQNGQATTQKNNAAVLSFAAAMQKAKAQAAANNGQAGSANGYVQTLQNDLKVLNTPVFSSSAHQLISAQSQARQLIYDTLMQASRNNQIVPVLNGLSQTDLSTITTQLEQGLGPSLPAFSQNDRNALFQAVVHGTSGQSLAASGQALAKFMGTFSPGSGAGANDTMLMLDYSGARSGLTDQILNNYNPTVLSGQLGAAAPNDQAMFIQGLSSIVSPSNMKRMFGFAAPSSSIWNATSPQNQAGDPINIIISGNSIPLDQILGSLSGPQAGAYWEVGNSFPWGTSAEYFNTGSNTFSNSSQDYSLRQGGLLTEANNPITSPTLPTINHFRAWKQNSTGASFISASYEYFNGTWHTVTSFNGARDDLLASLQTAADSKGWHMSTSWMQAPNGGGGGSDGVPYDGRVAVVTITA